MSVDHYTIGFANQSEKSPFAVSVRESLQRAVANEPNISLICRDNDLDDAQAIRNAQEFADLPVDLAIIYHINERAGSTLRGILQPFSIIAVDIPIQFATFFGVSNRQSGDFAGETLAAWIHQHWDGQVDKILALIDPRVLEVVRERIDFTISALASHAQFGTDDVFYLDCGNQRGTTIEHSLPILERWSSHKRIVVIGFNEDSTVGALEAVKRCGMEEQVVAVGHGSDKLLKAELQRPGTRLIAAIDYRPHNYGRPLLDLALRKLRGERVPQRNFAEIALLTASDVDLTRS